MNIINKVYCKYVGRGLQGSWKGIARENVRFIALFPQFVFPF